MDDFLQHMRTLTLERIKNISLETDCANARSPHEFLDIFKDNLNACVIAEIKFSAPSFGDICAVGDVVEIARQYLSNGASALSVITESAYFKGSVEYLREIREAFPLARLLMKDFILAETQLYQARSLGADAVLLIVGLLKGDELSRLYVKSIQLGLTPLVEVYTVAELEMAELLGAKLIGVNARNLHTLIIDPTVAESVIRHAKTAATMVALSGIHSGHRIGELKSVGYQGFLVGSHLMASDTPGHSLRRLLREVSYDAR